MKPITKRYANDDLVVVWQPHLCIHSGICFRGLPAVFDPRRRPWVILEGTASVAIAAQVAQCPSGALSLQPVAVAGPPAGAVPAAPDAAPDVDDGRAEPTRIEVQPNGPLLVYGALLVRRSDGTCALREGTTALCRCGGSSNKPFCDGTHGRIGFRG